MTDLEFFYLKPLKEDQKFNAMEANSQTVKTKYSVEEPLNREPPVKELISR